MCSLCRFFIPYNSPGLISQTRPRSDPLFFHLLFHCLRDHRSPFGTCSQISSSLSPCSFHSRSNPPFPFLYFHQSSLGRQIASSVFCSCGGTAGNNGRVGLVVVATGMRQGRAGKKGGGGDKEEERQREVEQAQRGCWLLAGRQGSERRLITLVSMPTAIKQHTHTPGF